MRSLLRCLWCYGPIAHLEQADPSEAPQIFWGYCPACRIWTECEALE